MPTTRIAGYAYASGILLGSGISTLILSLGSRQLLALGAVGVLVGAFLLYLGIREYMRYLEAPWGCGSAWCTSDEELNPHDLEIKSEDP